MSDVRDTLGEMDRRRTPGRMLAALVLAAVAAAVVAVGGAPVRAADPTPMPSADPGASASPSGDPSAPPSAAPTPTPAPTPIITVRNTYRAGAAVRQFTIYWCVPASAQTMLNVILRTKRTDTTRNYQSSLAKVIGVNNRYRYNVPGNDIRGWAKALNVRIPAGAGVMYRDRAFRSQTAAMWSIVSAIDATSYPVGITVWHGRHAWTVLGYRTSEMPNAPASRQILGFYVSGPLRTSRYADPFPSSTATRGVYLSLANFAANFSRYDEDKGRAPWHRSFVMVRPEPVLAPPGF